MFFNRDLFSLSSNYIDMLSYIRISAEDIMIGISESHSFDHVQQVFKHSWKAIQDFNELSSDQVFCILAASYLHEVDDHKYFDSEHYHNAVTILNYIDLEHSIVQDIIEIISLVGFSENGNTIPDDICKWKLIPRLSDRIEAVGQVGVVRCYQYTIETGRPFFTSNTPLYSNIDEMYIEAAKRKYTGKSDSMVDHYYDKLLKICSHPYIGSDYLHNCLKEKQQYLTEVLKMFYINTENAITYIKLLAENLS